MKWHFKDQQKADERNVKERGQKEIMAIGRMKSYIFHQNRPPFPDSSSELPILKPQRLPFLRLYSLNYPKEP